jgi:hypothetical protein
VALAQALDGVLREDSERYERLLDTLAPVTATEDDTRALWSRWGVSSPTDAERATFRNAMFDEDSVGDYSHFLGQRSSTIALARHHLSRCNGAQSGEEIRRGMYFSVKPNGEVYDVPENLQLALRKWIILQVRQLERLSLESLLSWCEARVIRGTQDAANLTAELERIFTTQPLAIDPGKPLIAILAKLDSEVSSIEAFVARGRIEELFSPFALMDAIQTAFSAKDEKYAGLCFYGLLLCASFAGCFAKSDRLVTVGGAARLSLFHLRKRLIALGDVSVKQTIQFVLESMVLSQHFATAVNRFDGQNQRLRLSIEEEGLISLAGKPWVPTVTEDRLPTILALSANCGLIRRSSDAFQH